MEQSKEEIENQIKELFAKWVDLKETPTKIRYAGPVIGKEEYGAICDALFADWGSGGKFTNEAERKLAQISERNHGLLANAGSSANLLLMSAARELYFKDGDKILTLSCGFPTTVNPIITNRMIPVFVDIDMETLNLSPETLEKALKSDNKIKGVFVAHTLGFKSKISELIEICRKYKVEIFFDNCDAYGTKYKGRPIQAYGKASTYSFYVAHHLTSFEGGGITTNDMDLHLAMRSFRNWGRYCVSPNCCVRSEHPNAFCPGTKLSKDCELPGDYIVNYQYEVLGYNLKPLELQSAMLIKQMDKLDLFDNIRRRNYKILYDYFQKQSIPFKTWKIDDETSPFAFPLLIPADAKFKRKHLIDFMSRNGIETRLLFGGNLTKHPAYQNRKEYWESFGGEHVNANNIMDNIIIFGVSQVNSEEQMKTICDKFDEFLKQW